jgi:DOPA 4,5-dioxygenase
MLKHETRNTRQNNAEQCQFAAALWERIRREFPELRIYKIWDRPIGPHALAMFEVNVFTPAQFGAFIPWLVIHRGPLSVLVHPNTDDEERDHTQRATWMGEKMPLDLSLFARVREQRAKEETLKLQEKSESGNA